MNCGDSSDGKDPAIKLFGKTIPVPECRVPTKPDDKSDLGCQIPGKSEVTDMHNQTLKIEVEDVCLKESGKEHNPPAGCDVMEEDNQLTGDRVEGRATGMPKEDETEASSVDQDKVLKKPDKILPCPRCNSFETKFCYFNNYNVNQPRHFCKNCQRYWTAGGTMRSVPVGAGRRKNKHLASQFQQILVTPGTVPTSSIEISQNSASQQLFSCDESRSTVSALTSNGTVLKFGPEGRICESMAAMLHLADQKNFVAELGSSVVEREDSSCGSFVTVSTKQENQSPAKTKEEGNLHGSCNEHTQPNTLQCFPVPPWVFPWNQVWNGGAPMVAARCSSELGAVPNDGGPNPVQWCSTPMLAGPGFCTPSIPLQFVPAPYWGCLPLWAAGTNPNPMPMVGYNGVVMSPSSSTSNSCSGNNSSNLGKHSRDENSMNEERLGKCVLVPKTLRVDDPDEASRSSIWATLGLKSNQQEPESRCGIFRPYKSITAECKDHPSDSTTQVYEANPAACSRSHTFQEST